jgi:hypothetical protein
MNMIEGFLKELFITTSLFAGGLPIHGVNHDNGDWRIELQAEIWASFRGA